MAPNPSNAPAPVPAADMASTPESEALARVLGRRYSCRGFLPTPVPDAVIHRILELAQRTASWCNAQPWQVVVTRGAATERYREAMLAAAATAAQPDLPWPREYRGAYQQRRRECGLALYDSVGIVRGDREASARQGLENFRLFGAPHVAIISSDEPLGVYGAVDCGAYVTNFMSAATSLGVATIAQAALASHPEVARAQFGIPADRIIVCGISFGYEDPAHPANGFRTTRAGIADTVSFFD